MQALSREIIAWVRAVWILINYFAYRLKIRRRPTFEHNKDDLLLVFSRALKWHKRMRIVHPERCPQDHPVVFCANHLKKDDPFITEAAIHTASGKIWVYHMMRDDFFSGSKNLLCDPDELVIMMGARLISREKVTMAQLKTFVSILSNHGSFLMFPAGTRSRTGAFMEYRELRDEPGGPAFFVSQAQKKLGGKPVPIVPMARTCNPVTKGSTLAFGEPLYLPEGAKREEQRRLDYLIVEKMGELLEIHTFHVLSGVLYLHALAGVPRLAMADLHSMAGAFADLVPPERLLHPALREGGGDEFPQAIRYLEKHGLVRQEGDGVLLNGEAILSAPSHDNAYKESNPMKYALNQYLHLHDVLSAVEKICSCAE